MPGESEVKRNSEIKARMKQIEIKSKIK